MASKGSTQSFVHLKRTKLSCMTALRILFIACIHVAQSNKQAFIQSDTILEALHYEGSLLQREADIDLSSYHQKRWWMYGDKVLTEEEAKAGDRVRGWFPRRCVEKCHYDTADSSASPEEKKDK